MTDVSPPAGSWFSKYRKWLVPALVASLSLNLLVAGFMLGHAIGGRRHGPGFGGPVIGGPAGPIGRFIGDLSADRRAALQGPFDAQRKAMADLAPAVRTARRDLAESLRATPFDRAKLETALQKLASAENALRSGTATLTGQLVEKLSDRERQGLERSLRRMIVGDEGRGADGIPGTP
jgi:uncharacterized membrane protein